MSGIRLTLGQANQAKGLRSSNGFPDIVIYAKHYESKEITKGYCEGLIYGALFLEVKKETPYKKDGSLKTDEHLFEQAEMHRKLINLGYHACFIWSFDQAKEIIDNYLK
jgi:hypothetical protein